VVIRRSTDLRARFDAAQTTDDNRRHWTNADSLSPDAALSPDVRRLLRNRARYEVANNSYAKGIGLTIANDTVGTGPTLQLLSEPEEFDEEDQKQVETLFWEWAQEIRLADKLRQMRFARFDSGEAFALFVNNPGLYGPVKLDIQVIEGEQIADPSLVPSPLDPQQQDGIRYDQYGNPVSYRKLRIHPGSLAWSPLPLESDIIPAQFVWHYYRADRPGQLRGIPDVTPALMLFAELRRYTNAVIAAAETAAEFAATVETDSSADPDAVEGQVGENPQAWDTIEIEKRAGLVLPAGYKLSQLKAEQPQTTYREFVNAKLNEIARCLCVPFHIAAMDPSLANMSSSYVVGQMYTKERLVDRCVLDYLLNKALDMWLTEALKINGFLPELPPALPHEWHWPSLSHHADPQKVANAAETELAAGLTTYQYEFAKRGLDWEEQQTAAAKSLGVSVNEYRGLLRGKLFGKPNQQQNDEGMNDETDVDQTEDADAVAEGLDFRRRAARRQRTSANGKRH
jgi:capsid protein